VFAVVWTALLPAPVPASAQTILGDWKFAQDADGNAVSDGQVIGGAANLKDDSGNGYKGNGFQSPKYAAYTPPAGSSKPGFDGFALSTLEGNIYFGDRDANPGLPSLSRNTDFSVWARVNRQVDTGEYQLLVGLPDFDLGSYQWALFVRPDGTLDLTFNAGIILTTGLFSGSGPAIDLGEWYDVGFSFSGVGDDGNPDTVKVYLDGALIGTFTLTANFTDNGAHLHVGALNAKYAGAKVLFDRVIYWEGIVSDAEFQALSISSSVKVTKLTFEPAIVPGCKNVTGKVFLDSPAPAGGAVVSLSTTNPAASVPASITVPAGATSKSFTISTTPVTSTRTGTVKATSGSSSVSKTLKVRPIGVQSVTLTPNPVTGGNDVTGKVTLECNAAPGDIKVTLSSTKPGIASPTVGSITIPAGSRTGTFSVSTTDVAVKSFATIKAKANGITKSKKLTVNP